VSRADLDAYWRETRSACVAGALRINPFALVLNALRDARLFVQFNVSFLSGYGK
jgi:hypothetical protein